MVTVDQIAGTEDLDETDVFDELCILIDGFQFRVGNNTYKVREAR